MSGGRELAGWIGAGLAAAGMFAGVAAAAMRLPEAGQGALPENAVALDMSVGVVALAEVLPSVPPVPQTVPQTVHTQAPPAPEMDEVPRLPSPDPAPVVERVAMPQIAPEPPLMLPLAEAPPVAAAPPPQMEEAPVDLAESPRPRSRPERVEAPRVEQRPPVQRAQAGPEREERPREAETAQPSAAQAAGAQQAAQPAQQRREAGGRAAARYGDLVMRQIARSPRVRAPERGVVTVGFEIGADGGLLRVAVVESSGSAALDQVAVDHIRRAAPFPPPPEGARTRFGFEFEGR